jgi:rubrerythrin/rhodanese-related sulfurtransferase
MNSAGIVDLDSKQLRAYLNNHKEQDFLLIDVRQPDEYKRTHIPGARPIPFPLVEEELPGLPKDKSLIFTCRAGIRSRAAATLAREILGGDAIILNHIGGILSWDDKTLSDIPKVRALGELDNLTTVLTAGIDMEKAAWIFYHKVLKRFPNQPFSQAFTFLAQAETDHALKLYKLLGQHETGLPDFETVFAAAKGEVLEGGGSLQAAIDKLSRPQAADPISLLDMALDIEYAAYELYRRGAEMANDPEIKDILYDIAYGEKAHMRVLAGAFRYLSE